jgi:hypothetical protein
MDATENDVPSQYDVRGFPTIYFAPKDSKTNPKKYEVRNFQFKIFSLIFDLIRVDVKSLILLNI